MQAVAAAARLFSRLDYVAACESTVRELIEPVMAAGFYHVYPIQRDNQCAYDISTLVVGLEELYGATGKGRYHDLALACAAWLDGDNPALEPVYDPRTGCAKDGLSGDTVSDNCGAESAIEAGFAELARRRLLAAEAQTGTGRGLRAVSAAAPLS